RAKFLSKGVAIKNLGRHGSIQRLCGQEEATEKNKPDSGLSGFFMGRVGEVFPRQIKARSLSWGANSRNRSFPALAARRPRKAGNHRANPEA
ncbi:hypothetical protein, partial [Propionivibrio sp.]|uniref:hypothetical protein n=1 Tax=Propionivibrio sp. TaxID=2212460 RepID=UPI00272E7CEA